MLWKSGINVYFGALWFKASTLKLVQNSSFKFLGKKKRLQNGQSITYWITMRTVMSDATGITHSAKAISWFFRAFPVWGQWSSEASDLLSSPPCFLTLSNSLCPWGYTSPHKLSLNLESNKAVLNPAITPLPSVHTAPCPVHYSRAETILQLQEYHQPKEESGVQLSFTHPLSYTPSPMTNHLWGAPQF